MQFSVTNKNTVLELHHVDFKATWNVVRTRAQIEDVGSTRR